MTDEPRTALRESTTEPPDAEPAAPIRKPWPMRTKILCGMLAAMVFTFTVNAGHIYMLEGELGEIAEEKAQEQLAHFGGAANNVETATLVTASKANLIFGRVSGKIEVFIKRPNQSNKLQGFDYFLSRTEDGEWDITESGTCTDEQCQIRGTKAFGE